MGGFLGFVVRAVPALAKNVLPFLSRAGDGKATKAGLVTGAVAIASQVAGNVVAPHIITDANVVEVIGALANLVTAVLGGISAIVTPFGVGRKAGKYSKAEEAEGVER